MLRRYSIYALIVLLVALLAAYLFVPPMVIEITKAQIDREMQRRLPYEVDRLIATITVNDATVQFGDDGKLSVLGEFEASGLTLEGTGSATVHSSLRYDDGRFYLSDLKRDDLAFTLSDNSNETISEAKSLLENVLRRETEEAKASGDEEQIENLNKTNAYYNSQLESDAISALDSFIGSFPVYNLNRTEGGLAFVAMALDDVEIRQDKVLATLSIQTFVKRLAIATLPVLILLLVSAARMMRIYRSIVRRT